LTKTQTRGFSIVLDIVVGICSGRLEATWGVRKKTRTKPKKTVFLSISVKDLTFP